MRSAGRPVSLLRDGARKAGIVAGTALLPRPWRVRSRERLLAHHELEKARRAALLIIGHPKSGNTWLKAMISRLYQVRHGLPENLLHKSDEYTRRIPEIPRLSATNGYYSYEGIVGRHLDAADPDPTLRDKAVMLLARHPCDIAVSWYFQFTRRQSRHKQELINHFIDHPIDRKSVEMWDFVRHSEIGLPCLVDYLNTWERNLERLPRSRVFRYEDLRASPESVLPQIMNLIDEPFSPEEIDEAVRFGSFDNLRKLETQSFFHQGGMTLRNPDDPTSFKVRRGKVGGYRDYFSEDQVAELDEFVAKRLSPSLGYGVSAPTSRAREIG
jgi:hypothetical protein